MMWIKRLKQSLMWTLILQLLLFCHFQFTYNICICILWAIWMRYKCFNIWSPIVVIFSLRLRFLANQPISRAYICIYIYIEVQLWAYQLSMESRYTLLETLKNTTLKCNLSTTWLSRTRYTNIYSNSWPQTLSMKWYK